MSVCVNSDPTLSQLVRRRVGQPQRWQGWSTRSRLSRGTTRFCGTKVSSSNQAGALSSTTSCSATGKSRTRGAERQGRQGQGALIQTNSAGWHVNPGRRQPRRSRTPRYRTPFNVFRKYVYLQGLLSVLDLHFIVTPVLIYILSTHRTGARPRTQQDRAGLSRHDLNRPSEDQAQQYLFVVMLFRKARTSLGFEVAPRLMASQAVFECAKLDSDSAHHPRSRWCNPAELFGVRWV